MTARDPFVTELQRDASRLSDALIAADRHAGVIASSVESMAPVQDHLSKLVCPSEREVCALIQLTMNFIRRSGWSHTKAATEAMESLSAAHSTLEDQAEVHG
jgi:hypothetical protein